MNIEKLNEIKALFKKIIKEVGYETYIMILMAIEDNIDFYEANINIYKRAYERYMQLDDVSLLSKEIKQIIEEERGI